MKILSNKEYKELEERNKIDSNRKDELEEEIKKTNQFYELKLNDIYNDLLELKNSLKQNISKDKIKIKVQDIIIKISSK